MINNKFCYVKKTGLNFDNNFSYKIVIILIICNKWLRVYKSIGFFEDNLADILFSDVLNFNRFMNGFFMGFCFI